MKRLADYHKNESISHGTHLDEQVAERIIGYLENDVWEELDKPTKIMLSDIKTDMSEFIDFETYNMKSGVTDSNGAFYMLVWEDLFNLMDTIAPTGTTFSAHVGDGSDFGFWEFENDDLEFGELYND
jgi:hypothetical protein